MITFYRKCWFCPVPFRIWHILWITKFLTIKEISKPTTTILGVTGYLYLRWIIARFQTSILQTALVYTFYTLRELSYPEVTINGWFRRNFIPVTLPLWQSRRQLWTFCFSKSHRDTWPAVLAVAIMGTLSEIKGGNTGQRQISPSTLIPKIRTSHTFQFKNKQ